MQRIGKHANPMVQFAVNLAELAVAFELICRKTKAASTTTRIRPYQICSRHLMDWGII